MKSIHLCDGTRVSCHGCLLQESTMGLSAGQAAAGDKQQSGSGRLLLAAKGGAMGQS